MNKEFLPVGTVVLLKGGTKRLMITGFCSVDNNDKTKLYDYTGCLYPEGIINSNEICLFDNEQIDKIYFRGFEDQEEINFKHNLMETVLKYQEPEETIELEALEDTPTITLDINDNIFAENNN